MRMNEKKSFLKKLFNRLSWEDYVFLVLILLYLIFNLYLIQEFKQLPSPIYGGDYYYSQGTIYHFRDGGNPFLSSAFLESLPHYFPVYTILAGSIAKAFSLSAFSAMKIFAVIEVILALIVFYALGNYLFKNKLISLTGILFYFQLVGGYTGFPIWKYLQFTRTLFLPLTVLVFLHFFKKRNLKSAVLAGIVWGLMGITHSVGFVVASLFILIISLYLLFFEYIRYENKKVIFIKEEFKKNFFQLLKCILVLFVIGVIIAQLYWFKPIFVYQGKPLNPIPDFAQPDFTRLSVKFLFITQSIKSFLLNFSSALWSIKSLFFVTGLLLLFFIKKHTLEIKFLILFLITTLIGSFHYFISQPFIGTNLSAHYIRNFTFALSATLFAVLAIKTFSDYIRQKFKLREKIKYVLLLLLLLILILNFAEANHYQKTNKWVNVGRQPLPPNLVEMQKWVLANTDVNDVFISTNELSFALNALTGRKLVTLKRGHTDLFTNASKNMLDAAIILYTNDTRARREILKQRKVKYLYWDYYWIRSEYYFNKQGQITGTFDPLVLFDTNNTRALLRHYNISFYSQHTWLDPAIRQPDVKQFDLIFILPYQFNLTHPWHPDLDNYLEEVWDYSQNGVVISRIYKIVNVD